MLRLFESTENQIRQKEVRRLRVHFLAGGTLKRLLVPRRSERVLARNVEKQSDVDLRFYLSAYNAISRFIPIFSEDP
jgi:hypothetical protein